MKKVRMVFSLVAIMVFVATSVWAAPITGPWYYNSPIDSILQYESLATASDAEEKDWIAKGAGYTDWTAMSAAGFFYYKDITPTTPTFLSGYIPDPTEVPAGFSWDYALVKVDGPNDYSYLFRDDNGMGPNPPVLGNGDDLLTTPAPGVVPYNLTTEGSKPPGPLGISHVAFVGKIRVPEPGTLLLLGLGLVGLAGLRRKF